MYIARSLAIVQMGFQRIPTFLPQCFTYFNEDLQNKGFFFIKVLLNMVLNLEISLFYLNERNSYR
jgi:hypothetical protein